jgi:hypothetical protein
MQMRIAPSKHKLEVAVKVVERVVGRDIDGPVALQELET